MSSSEAFLATAGSHSSCPRANSANPIAAVHRNGDDASAVSSQPTPAFTYDWLAGPADHVKPITTPPTRRPATATRPPSVEIQAWADGAPEPPPVMTEWAANTAKDTPPRTSVRWKASTNGENCATALVARHARSRLTTVTAASASDPTTAYRRETLSATTPTWPRSIRPRSAAIVRSGMSEAIANATAKVSYQSGVGE